jgi:hypothetical protein
MRSYLGGVALVHDGTEITCRTVAGEIEVAISSPKPRPVRLTILAARPAAGVRKDGTALIEKADPNAFASETAVWRHDPVTGFLELRFCKLEVVGDPGLGLTLSV